MLGRGSRSILATAAAVSVRAGCRPAAAAAASSSRRSAPATPAPTAGAPRPQGIVQRLAIVRRRPAQRVIGRAFSVNWAQFQYDEAPAAAADQQQPQLQLQEKPARWLRRKALEALLQFQVATNGELGEGAVATLKGLARLNAEAGEVALAVDLLERALAIQVEANGGGDDHPEAIDAMRELVRLYGGALGQPLAAMHLGERLLVAVRRAADGAGADGTEEVALTMRDVGRLKGFVRDHTGKRALLERALAVQRRVYGRELGGSEHHVEVLRTRLFLAAAQVAAAPLPPPLFSGITEASSAVLLEEANATVEFLLEIQLGRSEAEGGVGVSLALLHVKALLEGEVGRGKEKAELLQELLALRERMDGPGPATHETLDTVIDLAEALAQLKRRDEARALLRGKAVRMQEGMVFTPAQAIDVSVRSALAWGACGDLGTRVRMLERAHDAQEIFLAGDVSEALVQAKLELSEAVRLMGDRQRADLLAVGAEEARAALERQVGFPLRDDPRRLRLALMLESLGDRYF